MRILFHFTPSFALKFFKGMPKKDPRPQSNAEPELKRTFVEILSHILFQVYAQNPFFVNRMFPQKPQIVFTCL